MQRRTRTNLTAKGKAEQISQNLTRAMKKSEYGTFITHCPFTGTSYGPRIRPVTVSERWESNNRQELDTDTAVYDRSYIVIYHNLNWGGGGGGAIAHPPPPPSAAPGNRDRASKNISVTPPMAMGRTTFLRVQSATLLYM